MQNVVANRHKTWRWFVQQTPAERPSAPGKPVVRGLDCSPARFVGTGQICIRDRRKRAAGAMEAGSRFPWGFHGFANGSATDLYPGNESKTGCKRENSRVADPAEKPQCQKD